MPGELRVLSYKIRISDVEENTPVDKYFYHPAKPVEILTIKKSWQAFLIYSNFFFIFISSYKTIKPESWLYFFFLPFWTFHFLNL